MAFFTVREILDLVIMTAALGFIFMSYVKRPRTELDLIERHGFNWEEFKFAILITAPGIVLHELAHKFAALAFGLTAVFHASYFGLVLGIFLKLINSPFIIFAPGYVSIGGLGVQPLIMSLTAFVGPLMNLVLFLAARWLLEKKRKLTTRQAMALYITKQVNLFLFIFNMLPIPPFDGYKVFYGIFSALF